MALREAPSLWPALDAWVDPATFDFWAKHVSPLWSWNRALARIVELREEAADTVSLVLKPNRHFRGFEAGQHIPVSAELNGRRVTRSYSLTHPPETGRHLRITVKRVEGGKLSTHLCRSARVGDILSIGPAFGRMTLPKALTEGWLFLAAGSGITPLLCLTLEMGQRGMPVPLTLIYWVRHRSDLCFVSTLQSIARQHPRFQVHFVVTDERAEGMETGLIDAEQLERLCPEYSYRHVYACGPSGFVERARGLCTSVRSFFAEGFTPPQREPGDGPEEVVVELGRSGRRLKISTKLSLLEALEAQGLNPAHGCRMGVCHTCVCPRISGSTLDLQTGAIEDDPGRDVRLCVSRARSDLVLELQE